MALCQISEKYYYINTLKNLQQAGRYKIVTNIVNVGHSIVCITLFMVLFSFKISLFERVFNYTKN